MLTVFERIPDYFVERYDGELQAWGANFSKIGAVKTIVLREGGLADLSPNEEQGAVLLAVKLIAKMERGRDRVTVTPLGEQDEALIARHCEKMQAARIPARAVLVEPARPWLPFMPSRLN